MLPNALAQKGCPSAPHQPQLGPGMTTASSSRDRKAQFSEEMSGRVDGGKCVFAPPEDATPEDAHKTPRGTAVVIGITAPAAAFWDECSAPLPLAFRAHLRINYV